MMNKNRHAAPSRIPVHFADEPSKPGRPEESDAGGDDAGGAEQTAEELGRASSYEDATEMQRRIDRGQESDDEGGRAQADDADAAGGPDPSELPESREDRDTKPPLSSASNSGAAAGDNSRGEPDGEAAPKADASSGPMLAELLATRAELRRIEGELQKGKAERQDLVDKFARRQADFENYRKRTERERGETYSRVSGEVVGHLLPVVDNLKRALDAEATVQATESEEFRHFLNGIVLIGKQLDGLLTTLGVEVVPTVGEKFDPHVHEAIATEETAEFESGTVTLEVVRGYKLGNKLLRPAMVKVAR